MVLLCLLAPDPFPPNTHILVLGEGGLCQELWLSCADPLWPRSCRLATKLPSPQPASKQAPAPPPPQWSGLLFLASPGRREGGHQGAVSELGSGFHLDLLGDLESRSWLI